MTTFTKGALTVAVVAAFVAGVHAWGPAPATTDAADADQQNQEVLARYQREFPRGTTRQVIRATLQAQNVPIEDPDMVIPASGRGDLLVKIGESKAGPWYCSSQWTYVDMRFLGTSNGLQLDPNGALEQIDIEKQDKDCL